MKILIKSLAATLIFCFPISVFSQDQCSSIRCDCDSLPSKSWVETCKNQEARLIADCVKNNGEFTGAYCSLHGPMANRVPLELDVDEKEIQLFSSVEVPKLNNKVAVLYWAIIKDFDSFESNVKKENYASAAEKLQTIHYNVDELFKVQLQVGKSFSHENKHSLAQGAWRDYSADTLSFGSDFFIRAEALLNTYDDIADEKMRIKARDIGLDLMALSGKVYEHAGFAYASGMRHKHAAKAWKNAADASALVMAHAPDEMMKLKHDGYYRFQSAARLHRASYHWVIGSGRGGAQESLAESQKFMEDGSSISGIVEEERQINESKPYWNK